MASIVNFLLQQVVTLPDSFCLVEPVLLKQIEEALGPGPLRDQLAALTIYTKEQFVRQAAANVSILRRGKPLPAARDKRLGTTTKPKPRELRASTFADLTEPSESDKLAEPNKSDEPPTLAQVAEQFGRPGPRSVASNISENVSIKRRDLVYLLDQLIKSRNEAYLLRVRLEAYEHVLTWAFQFLTFVQAFSTLVFHNGLPISAVIFNTDMFNVPFSLIDYIERKMHHLETDVDAMYRNVMWTQSGVLTSGPPRVEGFSFRRAETNAFLDNVERIRRDYLAFAEAYNRPNDFITRGLVDIIPNAEERERLIGELRDLCVKYRMNDFSPQYLLQQSHLASLLMHFATTIYSYVPQLQVDLVSEQNFEFSLSKYLARLREFWQKQTNLAIGPFHVHYSMANMNRLRDSDLQRMYSDFVRDRSDYANLSVECQQTLSQLTFNTLNRHVSLGPEIKLSNAWRNLFNELASVPDAHADLTLYKKFMEYASADPENLFSTRVLVKFDRIFANDYLANLVYNFREQILILKLIVVQLLIRRSLPPGYPPNNMHDPIMALKERLSV